MAIYYFGYGSNMAAATMQAWCGDSRVVGMAQLKGYRLAFTRKSERWGQGVADVVRDEDGSVWGVLYEVSDGDLANLDKKEGNGHNYQRIAVEVLCDDAPCTAYTYEVIAKLPDDIPTSRDYKQTLLAGAYEMGLPAAYIVMLEALPIADDTT